MDIADDGLDLRLVASVGLPIECCCMVLGLLCAHRYVIAQRELGSYSKIAILPLQTKATYHAIRCSAQGQRPIILDKSGYLLYCRRNHSKSAFESHNGRNVQL